MAFNMNKKRKQRTYDNREPSGKSSHADGHGPDPSLFIQAHEADLVRGPHVAATAKSLEFTSGVPGDGLIERKARHGSEIDDFLADDHVQLKGSSVDAEAPQEGIAIWVDRYDARLLLEALPDVTTTSTVAEPSSPSGWSDLPSDTEDTFFFSATEAEDYRREKRRRLIDGDREARLRALRTEAGDEDVDPQETWGGSDEEPDEAQRELMHRTASHIIGSPNSAQLEMRILANHGADRRFAFLRGRWSRAWRVTKAKLHLEVERKRKEEVRKKVGIVGLAAYGDSDEDEDVPEVPAPLHNNDGTVPPTDEKEKVLTETADEDAVKAARRARAREWAEQRRALKEIGGTQE